MNQIRLQGIRRNRFVVKVNYRHLRVTVCHSLIASLSRLKGWCLNEILKRQFFSLEIC